MYSKITIGFVIQTYNDDGTPREQRFVAGDQVSYETPEGAPLEAPDEETYLPFEMHQPGESA